MVEHYLVILSSHLQREICHQKNIAILSEKEYITLSISKVECYKKDETDFYKSSNGKQSFGFKSPKCPPAIDGFRLFESDLQRIISNIEFRPVQNKFLSKLNKDMNNIKKTKKILINTDTSTSIYKMSEEDYQKHLQNNITKTHKKPIEKVNDVSLDGNKIPQKIAKKLEIDDRVEKMQ